MCRAIGEIEPLIELYKLKIKTPNPPKKPVYPTNEDCCGSGCVPCVYDIYEKDFTKWKEYQQKLDPKLRFKDFGTDDI